MPSLRYHPGDATTRRTEAHLPRLRLHREPAGRAAGGGDAADVARDSSMDTIEHVESAMEQVQRRLNGVRNLLGPQYTLPTPDDDRPRAA